MNRIVHKPNWQKCGKLGIVDRSISGWRSLQISLPEKAESIKPMLIELESLRRSIEARFPRARDFIRPGLDEVNSRFVS